MSGSEPRASIRSRWSAVPFSVILFGVLLLRYSSAAADIFSEPTSDSIPELIRSLGDPNVQLGASRALAALKSNAVAPLQQALDAESSEVRIWAAYTLGRIGHDASPAVSKLTETLSKASDAYERATAAGSLGQIATAESAAKEVAVRGLIAGLSDPDEKVRCRAATALGQLGPTAHKATDTLVPLFADDPVREAAVAAVTAIGKPAVPTLVSALDDDTLRLEAARALRSIDPAAALRAKVDRPSERDLPALRLALLDEDRDGRSRIEATLQLGEIGVEAASTLIAAFSSESESVARAAAAAFKQVGSAALPLLKNALTADSPSMRAKAADALGAIGPSAKPAVPSLIEALSDSDRTVQHRVVTGLGACGEAASEAVPELIKVMQNPRVLEQTRSLALKVLVRASSDSQHDIVIAALEESSEDSNYGISSLAKSTLKTIQKTPSTSP